MPKILYIMHYLYCHQILLIRIPLRFFFYCCSSTLISIFPPPLSAAPPTSHPWFYAPLALSMGLLYMFLDIGFVSRRKTPKNISSSRGYIQSSRVLYIYTETYICLETQTLYLNLVRAEGHLMVLAVPSFTLRLSDAGVGGKEFTDGPAATP